MRQATRQRQERIMTELLERKHVLVTALAAQLTISESTVRRDLRALAEAGKVVLVHGGATPAQDAEFSFHAKQRRHLEAKQLVAKLAADLVADGDHVFLDSGTTCFEMAAHLRTRRAVTVLINSVRLAPELHAGELKVILLGGQYRPERADTVGPIAIRSIGELQGYVAFIGADGLNMEGGPAAVDIESADVFRAVIGNARETVLVVDHTKFERPSLYRIVPWDKVTRVVSDREPPEAWREFLREHDIEAIFPTE